MPKRCLGNLLRAGNVALGHDPVHSRNRDWITGYLGRFDRHARWEMDGAAKHPIVRDGEIDARIIPCHRPSSPAGGHLFHLISWFSIGSKNSIPEEINHREIAIGMAVMGKMELLLAPEPRKAAKP